LPQKQIGMLEINNVFNVAMESAWVSGDRFKSESCHKKQIGMFGIS